MALARVPHQLRKLTDNPTTYISTSWTKQRTKHIRTADITKTITTSAIALNLDTFGINPAQVGSHSLRAGSALALHLGNTPAHVIRKMGRWKSDAFLSYLHAQIACFSKGLSTLMSLPRTFHNVARIPTSPLA